MKTFAVVLEIAAYGAIILVLFSAGVSPADMRFWIVALAVGCAAAATYLRTRG